MQHFTPHCNTLQHNCNTFATLYTMQYTTDRHHHKIIGGSGSNTTRCCAVSFCNRSLSRTRTRTHGRTHTHTGTCGRAPPGMGTMGARDRSREGCKKRHFKSSGNFSLWPTTLKNHIILASDLSAAPSRLQPTGGYSLTFWWLVILATPFYQQWVWGTMMQE